MDDCNHSNINNIVRDYDGISRYTCNDCQITVEFSKLYRRYYNNCNHDPKEMVTYKNSNGEVFCLKCGSKL